MTVLSPLWITEAEVISLLDLRDAIAALEHGLRLEARGEAANMAKTYATWGSGHTLHALGATFAGAGFVGTKTWAHTEGGATPLLILFDSETGALKAMIEAFALGQMRTGGISGVATRWLAAPDADELAIVGTGKQALLQVAAVAAVRPLKRVRVYSPTAAHRAQFADRLQTAFPFTVVEAQSVREAVDGAPIITLVTRATQPFLTANMVIKGVHINAVGAILPSRVEFAQDIFPRCGRVVVDSLESVQELSREFRDYYGTGTANWDEVMPLCSLVAAQQTRPADCDLTLFKAMGMGVSDLAVGIEIYERATRQGVGRSFPHPQRVTPRL
jgi:ornithine cyclodeaminase/alanine dehydrogenase-like protein (mu-crystallin family)